MKHSIKKIKIIWWKIPFQTIGNGFLTVVSALIIFSMIALITTLFWDYRYAEDLKKIQLVESNQRVVIAYIKYLQKKGEIVDQVMPPLDLEKRKKLKSLKNYDFKEEGKD